MQVMDAVAELTEDELAHAYLRYITEYAPGSLCITDTGKWLANAGDRWVIVSDEVAEDFFASPFIRQGVTEMLQYEELVEAARLMREYRPDLRQKLWASYTAGEASSDDMRAILLWFAGEVQKHEWKNLKLRHRNRRDHTRNRLAAEQTVQVLDYNRVMVRNWTPERSEAYRAGVSLDDIERYL
jgi:hypothetical protein